MKTLAIFGATGQTGLHLVAQALFKGHNVKAIVRNEAKLKEGLEKDHDIKDHENLNIIKVEDMFDEKQLEEPLKDVDVCLSTLGFGRGSTGYVDVTKAMTKALLTNENGCRRCIFMHSWYSEPTARVNCPFFLRWTLLVFIGPILDNMRKAEEFLQGQEDIDYSVVLPAGLVNGKATDCEFLSTEDSWFVPGVSGRIQRADVARYMLKVVEEDLHHKKIVAISPK